jgi:Fe2+ or Zn2+ uptake regulation protein
MRRLSKNQKKIIELLQIKPDMTTKEIAELTFGRIVEYKSKDYSSIHRSLMSLERQGCIQRVHVQLKWRLAINDRNQGAYRIS